MRIGEHVRELGTGIRGQSPSRLQHSAIVLKLRGANYYSPHKHGRFQNLVMSFDLVTMIQ